MILWIEPAIAFLLPFTLNFEETIARMYREFHKRADAEPTMLGNSLSWMIDMFLPASDRKTEVMKSRTFNCKRDEFRFSSNRGTQIVSFSGSNNN